jgi:hypothetical protein
MIPIGAYDWGSSLLRFTARFLGAGARRSPKEPSTFGLGSLPFGLEIQCRERCLAPRRHVQISNRNGKQIEDFDQDWTDSYHQGMVVPVFYDSALPENHVAM